MKKFFIQIVCLLTLFSCQTKDKPKEVMNQAQLSAFLVDVYLAEARLDQMAKPKDSTIKYFLPFEEKLLKQHGVSDSVVKITYTYYMEHPKELEQVYDMVIDTLMVHDERANVQLHGNTPQPQNYKPASAPPTRGLQRPPFKEPKNKPIK